MWQNQTNAKGGVGVGLTTQDRIRTYLASGADRIEIDAKTAEVLCRLADFGVEEYRRRQERLREHSKLVSEGRMAVRFMWASGGVFLLISALRLAGFFY